MYFLIIEFSSLQMYTSLFYIYICLYVYLLYICLLYILLHVHIHMCTHSVAKMLSAFYVSGIVLKALHYYLTLVSYQFYYSNSLLSTIHTQMGLLKLRG